MTKVLTPYKRTEAILYSYPKLLKAVEIKENRIEAIRENGLNQKSKGIVPLGVQGGERLNEFDKIEQKIEEIENSIQKTKIVIEMTKNALEVINEEEYYQVIELKYFKNRTIENIAEELNSSYSTIQRQAKKLITDLTYVFFSDEAIESFNIA